MLTFITCAISFIIGGLTGFVIAVITSDDEDDFGPDLDDDA